MVFDGGVCEIIDKRIKVVIVKVGMIRNKVFFFVMLSCNKVVLSSEVVDELYFWYLRYGYLY